ncbi:hypothetical protein BpHYR1_023045 [Brachionus plicatilis]|uniref:Uncharacterized protein n=1 Tax=Brachionus plicatilis TaxID=10195 RepID=A0A3M7QN32_BRAPC|nr:hypothetical protein BpHYR1_023045 [Brachionus plicatilis]
MNSIAQVQKTIKKMKAIGKRSYLKGTITNIYSNTSSSFKRYHDILSSRNLFTIALSFNNK